jgi:hypothetical protein
VKTEAPAVDHTARGSAHHNIFTGLFIVIPVDQHVHGFRHTHPQQDGEMNKLKNMFMSGTSFRRSANANGRHLWFGRHEGVKYGVVLANEWHGNYALNKDSLETLLAAKAAGKIDEPLVVETNVNTDDGSRTLTYAGEKDAAEVRANLERETPRSGRYGAYWVRTSFVNDDDPF